MILLALYAVFFGFFGILVIDDARRSWKEVKEAEEKAERRIIIP